MQHDGFRQLLDGALNRALLATPYGNVYRADEPVEIPGALGRFADSVGERQRIEDEGLEVLGEDALRDVIFFAWNTMGDTGARLQLLTLGGDRAYVAWVADPYNEVVAAMDDERAFPALFVSLIGTNGESCGTEMFGSLPSETVNRMPTLLPAATVKAAYRAFLGDPEREGEWGYLVDQRDKQPDPSPRATAGGDPGTVDAYHDRILDRYFARTYTEREP